MSRFPEMKRFLVFIFDKYYPSGGWNDFTESFDELLEARGYMRGRVCPSSFSIGHILDRETWQVVARMRYDDK